MICAACLGSSPASLIRLFLLRFNSFRDLGTLFEETARIIKEGGIFAFTVEEQMPGQNDRYTINRVDVSEKPKAETAVIMFRHSNDYIAQLLDDTGFILLKSLDFLAFKYH
jgi:predicted TPR repeat methyltransferase